MIDTHSTVALMEGETMNLYGEKSAGLALQ